MKFKDYNIDTTYTIQEMNLIELRDEITKTYLDYDIIFNEFSGVEKTYGKNYNYLTDDVYIYNNINIIKDGDKIILLDGHRRLYYNYDVVPNFNVPVRVYDKSVMSDVQILKLMVNLNQHKLVGSGCGVFIENGFKILLKVLFNVDISDKMNIVTGLLCENTYSISYMGDTKPGLNNMDRIIDRITNEHFISIIRFISKVNNECLNSISKMGYLFYSFLNEHGDVLDNVHIEDDFFENKGILTSHGADSKYKQKFIDKMFTKLMSAIGEDVITVSSQLTEIKKLKDSFKKLKYPLLKENRALALHDKAFEKILSERKAFKLHVLFIPIESGGKVLPFIHKEILIDNIHIYSHLLSKRVDFFNPNGIDSDMFKDNDFYLSGDFRIIDKNGHGDFLYAKSLPHKTLFYVGDLLDNNLKIEKYV